ncbi:PIN domain-containing protein [uncultured Microbacterium sp.]|uniref:PIN domain-containing protein n=1 Tax=uncultured Microbacterium sp. TaxID=191216 RepID=UPI0035CA6AD7
MIALDASFVIALRSTSDAHADAADAAFSSMRDERCIHPVTLAEILVDPARHGREGLVRSALVDAGISLRQPDEDEPIRVAQLRVQTRLALPDCYVLALADRTHAAVASFDARLRAAAAARGLALVPA